MTNSVASSVVAKMGNNPASFSCPSGVTGLDCQELEAKDQYYHDYLVNWLATVKYYLEANSTTILTNFAGTEINSHMTPYYQNWINASYQMFLDNFVSQLPITWTERNTVMNADTKTYQSTLEILVNNTVNYTLTYAELKLPEPYLKNSTYADKYDKKAHGTTVKDNIDYYTPIYSSAVNDLWNKKYNVCLSKLGVTWSTSQKSKCVDTTNSDIQDNYEDVLYGYGAQLIASSMIALDKTNVTDLTFDNAYALYNEVFNTWPTTLVSVCTANSKSQGGQWKPKNYGPPPKKSKKDSDADDNGDATKDAEDDAAEDAGTTAAEKAAESASESGAEDAGAATAEAAGTEAAAEATGAVVAETAAGASTAEIVGDVLLGILCIF